MTENLINIRAIEEIDLDEVASIWYQGWQDAHAKILPKELAQYRTLDSFKQKLRSFFPNIRVACKHDKLVGFSITDNDELNQFYVTADARGSGVAAALLADAEKRLHDIGIKTAWLACAIGNYRAAKFYEKNGWCRVGNMISQLPTPDGLFPLEVWRYEKHLTANKGREIGEIPTLNVKN